MKAVLVHPAGSNWFRSQRDVTALANRGAPIGILSMASYLEQQGHRVEVLDCLGQPGRMGDHIREILAHKPDVVGFSATTSAFMEANEMASLIKAKAPHLRVICGGAHPSSLGPALLQRFPSIDYLCLGEGEATLGELLDGQDPAQITGLVWRDGEHVVSNPPRTRLPDLDALPFPAYEKLRGFPRQYTLPLFSYVKAPGATMITSRGCPYRCSYCDRSVFGRGFRYNSADYIYEQMAWLRSNFGVRHVNIYDDLFTTNRKRVAELCQKLASNPLGLNFNCAVRVGHTDDDLLIMLKEAGALMVSIGMESGDEALLERHKAGVELDEVRETTSRIKAHGLRIKGLFMMGLPGETEKSARQTSDFIQSLELDDMNLSKFCPFPGAPCWETIHDEGTFDEDWPLMNCLNFVFVPGGMSSRSQMDSLYNQYVRRFYQDPRWRRQFRRRLWQHRHSLWRLIKHLPAFLGAKRLFES